MSEIQAPISNAPVENRSSHIPSNINNYVYISLILILGVALIYLLLQIQQIKNTANNQTNTVSDVEKSTIDEIQQDPQAIGSSEISGSNNWISTDIAGGGITFKYPLGWHVASADLEDYYSQVIYISDEPIMTTTTHGPDSMLFMYIRRGFENPEQTYKDNIEANIASLENVKQEMLTSKYFSEIPHISGELKEIDFESGSDNYFLFNTDPKFGDLSDSTNRTLITISINQSYGLGEISGEKRKLIEELILSVKECHLTSCDNE